MKYLKLIIATISLIGLFSMSTAAADSFVADACSGVSQLSSTQGCSSGGDTIEGVVKTVVSIMSIIVGSLSVIMIIVASIKFVTSSGDSNGVASARNTLIYALVGLAVAVLAQLLVHFVLNTADTIQSNSAAKKTSLIRASLTGNDS